MSLSVETLLVMELESLWPWPRTLAVGQFNPIHKYYMERSHLYQLIAAQLVKEFLALFRTKLFILVYHCRHTLC